MHESPGGHLPVEQILRVRSTQTAKPGAPRLAFHFWTFKAYRPTQTESVALLAWTEPQNAWVPTSRKPKIPRDINPEIPENHLQPLDS